eukprot:GHVU01207377.1.p1 GENE.GHVU01207377.1~~GHVU01207377.1.p1  ORF type:complete len:133 (+),score=15.56 GHVU01207377.1:284-682(+)
MSFFEKLLSREFWGGLFGRTLSAGSPVPSELAVAKSEDKPTATKTPAAKQAAAGHGAAIIQQQQIQPATEPTASPALKAKAALRKLLPSPEKKRVRRAELRHIVRPRGVEIPRRGSRQLQRACQQPRRRGST